MVEPALVFAPSSSMFGGLNVRLVRSEGETARLSGQKSIWQLYETGAALRLANG